jgi:hypothetical protein
MLKKVFFICSLLSLVACDKVDVSKYPQDVQNCYNKMISSPDNCTKSKKNTLKYCDCLVAGKKKIKASDEKSVSDSIRVWMDVKKLYKRCADEARYKVCKKDEAETK